ncbi:MAG: c-type cytochrome [bacterium]|jgi:thiosulfate dehydrogenase|nr:c-type cytochrome [Chitinophagaceae bacterium]
MNNSKQNWIIYSITIALVLSISVQTIEFVNKPKTEIPALTSEGWMAPSLFTDRSVQGEERALVIYGEELIANTSRYLGPNGSVAHVTNGMNCQNCHLNAGRKTWGNNYGAVAANYPKFRDRSGSIETVYKRVSDCMERSLNGSALDSNSHEMKAMIAYIKWVGYAVPKDSIPKGSGIKPPEYLDRAASPEKGLVVYTAKCQSCHGANGEGLMAADAQSYTYPPLWGEHSYNNGAGLFRLSRLAGYVRDNMPFNQATHRTPVLTDEESWDVAAFVNSRPRPSKDLSKDWPNISKKPIDHPFGPYTDGFTEEQHKFGPFKPIIEARKK